MDQQALYAYLSSFITEHKKQLFEENIRYRTRHLAVVLEDIYQPHNASAVIRSCDCFGIQDLHIIEERNPYKLNPDVALGSSKWVSMYRYAKRAEAVAQLKAQGYRLVGTTPRAEHSIHDLPLTDKVALVFGTELTGMSEAMVHDLDESVRIPMYGFTESFNISVSVAISLNTLVHRLHGSEVHWQLSEQEQLEVKLDWVRRTLRNHEMLEKRFTDKGQ